MILYKPDLVIVMKTSSLLPLPSTGLEDLKGNIKHSDAPDQFWPRDHETYLDLSQNFNLL
jgi:hypothetical protein